MKIIIEKQKHYHFGNEWVTIKANDYLSRVKPVTIRRNGTKFFNKDINLAKTILRERLIMVYS